MQCCSSFPATSASDNSKLVIYIKSTPKSKKWASASDLGGCWGQRRWWISKVSKLQIWHNFYLKKDYNNVIWMLVRCTVFEILIIFLCYLVVYSMNIQQELNAGKTNYWLGWLSFLIVQWHKIKGSLFSLALPLVHFPFNQVKESSAMC